MKFNDFYRSITSFRYYMGNLQEELSNLTDSSIGLYLLEISYIYSELHIVVVYMGDAV